MGKERDDEEATERALVERLRSGDGGAVERLMARLLPGLKAFLRSRAGHRMLQRESSSDLAQSVCREVLADLAEGTFRYQGEQEFKQWLYQAAALKVQDRARYWAAQRRSPDREDARDLGDERYQELLATLGTPSRNAAAREELEALRRSLGELPEHYRQAIVMARIEGRPHAEIAARLGIAEQASRMLLSRALARLATLASRHGGGTDRR